ncbi:MAG: Peptidylprolyl isomerase [Bacteroidetes bacterium]|nr:Peptidylprolyl isomerase [Bacteroidota bacterium]
MRDSVTTTMRLAVRTGFILFIFSLLESNNELRAQSILAKVGSTSITEEEFQLRFELTPSLGRNRKSQLETEKLEFLYSLVAEKLLALEAQDRRLDLDSTFRHAFAEIKKLIVRDELYRQEISNKVTVKPQEIQQGIKHALDQRLVEFLYFTRREDAEFVRSKVRKASEIERVQIDSSIECLKDTATVIWGEASPAIEDAAYRLKPGDVSPVIHEGPGFYILWVKGSMQNAQYASLQPSALQERVTQVIRLRKERKRLDEFVPATLRNDTAFAGSAILRRISIEMTKATDNYRPGQVVTFDALLLKKVKDSLKASLGETAVVSGKVAWSVESILDRLLSAKFEFVSGDTLKTFLKLNGHVRIWAQQELLAQEGLRRGLEQSYGVQKKLSMWYQAFLAGSMKDYIKRRINVSQAEVWQALQVQDGSSEVPRVQIRELWTSSLDSMKAPIIEVGHGVSFEKVAERYSIDSFSRKSGGVTPAFPVNERSPLGEIAWQMQAGERFGPIPLEGKFIYFELVKKDFPVARDTVLAARFEKTKREFLQAKFRSTVNSVLAQAGVDRGFSVFEDRVKQLKVTPFPMVTFRILGFGGRMFEVPLLEKQLDWLDTEPPRTKVVP